ncbi:MAG: molybdopterin-dependent oxidoreductase [Verrucomicrobiaceae bacterium]|nr:molybdopterin-dependent oxidoreductase [Verrucomicrobiaceae bacterium]
MAVSKKSSEDLVNVQVDGHWIRVPKGTRMIEACKQAAAEVPHYCYHPKLTSPGNCRMCLVEMGMPPRPTPGEEAELDAEGHAKINWMPRPVIACANTVAEGMGIRTQSLLAKECRQGVMEFLLINHPLDCPICDQAGECTLQEYSVEHGNGQSRFLESKVKKPKNVDIGPRIRLDDERCVLCSRCVRFSKEVVDDDVLGFVDRGSHNTLAVHPDRKLENNYSLNTVDICPVGALTSNDFRFKMRVWFMRETKSLCTGCARGCNTLIGSREGKIYRQGPRENNKVNSAWMCDSGRMEYHRLEDPARLTDPMIKRGRTHNVVDWTEAICRAAKDLSRFKGDELAIIASGGMTNEELYLTRTLAESLEAGVVDVVKRSGSGDDYLSHSDKNPNVNGARKILKLRSPGSRLKLIHAGIAEGKIKALLVLGEDLLDIGFSEEELGGLKCMVLVHMIANPTAKMSTVVLPGAGYAEKRGSMINATGRLQRLNKAIDSPGLSREDWEILQGLNRAVDGKDEVTELVDVFGEMTSAVSIFKGLSFAGIGDLGVDVMDTGESVPLLEREAKRVRDGLIVG